MRGWYSTAQNSNLVIVGTLGSSAVPKDLEHDHEVLSFIGK